MKNKRGNALFLVMFFLLLFVIMGAGIALVFGSAITNYVLDEAVPELTSLGVIEDTNINLTDIGGTIINPVNQVIQSFTFITGILYVFMLIGIVALAFVARTSASSNWLIGLFFMLVVLLMLGSILISNIYQDFYQDSGDIGDRLKEHTLLSFLLLHSPLIMLVVSFIGGIVFFSGLGGDE